MLMGKKKQCYPIRPLFILNALVVSMLDGRAARPSFVENFEVKIFKIDEMG
jgi:hypothetical protein